MIQNKQSGFFPGYLGRVRAADREAVGAAGADRASRVAAGGSKGVHRRCAQGGTGFRLAAGDLASGWDSQSAALGEGQPPSFLIIRSRHIEILAGICAGTNVVALLLRMTVE